METIIWRLQVQSWLQASNNTGILNTCTRLWPTESEQATPVDSIKDVVRSSMKVPEFDKHLKKAGGHIGRKLVKKKTIKMKTIVRKPLMIRTIKLRLFWRCPWCNCYRRRKWTRRHEFKYLKRLIAFHIALIPLGKVWIQLFSLQLWVNSRTD